MQTYKLINHIVSDIISESLNSDFIHFRFIDNIRFNHSEYKKFLETGYKYSRRLSGEYMPKPEWCNDFVTLAAGPRAAAYLMPDHNTQSMALGTSYLYHNKKWVNIFDIDKMFKIPKPKNTPVFIEHQWEPINFYLDKIFWQGVEFYQQNLQSQHFVLHSERNSNDIDNINKMGIKDVHWFGHAYLCSEFYYKNYSKLKMVTDYKSRPINSPWICANRLLRDYRIEFLHCIDYTKGTYSLLEQDATGKKLWGSVPPLSFDNHGNDSAEICVDDLTPWNTSFLHCVMETIWQEKIHFSEKIFKPIVLHQPFVLLQAPGSLEYLRSYGFKTFGDWWDESYDSIEDPKERMNAIAKIVDWITTQDLYKMREEMSGVLEHNFRHFYENIPDIVLDELRVNLKNAV